jgi:hypothetical protein
MGGSLGTARRFRDYPGVIDAGDSGDLQFAVALRAYTQAWWQDRGVSRRSERISSVPQEGSPQGYTAIA